MTVLVVLSTLLGVGEDLIGLGSLLEALLGLLVALVLVGMVLYSLLAEGLLDLDFRGVAVNAQYLVVISFIAVRHNDFLDNATSSDPVMRRCPLLKFRSV
jgi:hypothetical protein